MTEDREGDERDDRSADAATGGDGAPPGTGTETDEVEGREPSGNTDGDTDGTEPSDGDVDGVGPSAGNTAGGGESPSTADAETPEAGEEPSAAGEEAPEAGEEPSAADDRPPEDEEPPDDEGTSGDEADLPADVRKYARFKKMDGAQYERTNEFLRERTYITAREWAIARLCADFRTETGVEMTKIGEHLPELVPFMEDTYTPQAVNQARASFEEKVRTAGATFLYGAMCDFFTPAELDDLMYEVTEVAKFLLEVEGVDLGVEAEMEAEDRISEVMREVREASEGLRYEQCPNCGHDLRK